jgi:predicted phage terminase large subunit-like protein
MNQHNPKALQRALLRGDLGAFVVKVFKEVSPGDDYLHSWHIDAIIYQLLRVNNGDLKRLIINQPPRSLKTICTSIAYVAWCLGHNPSMKFACVSYSNDLAATFHRMFRQVVTSDWYQALFPKFRIEKSTETELVTTLTGGRYASSVGGTITGRGFDVIILDDPLKADEAHSDLARSKCNKYFREALFSRLDNPETGSFICVSQRLHEDDLPGNLLEQGGWHHLDLPAIAEEDQVIPIGPAATHQRKKGDVLHPARQSAEVLEAHRKELGPLVFSAQYQQRPVPAAGNLVKRDWIQWYDSIALPLDGSIVQSWDVASSTAKTSDYSVCTTWRISKDDYYLVDVWRDRVEFPDLKRKVIDLCQRHSANDVLIEKAGLGLNLYQELVRNSAPGFPRPIGIKPEGTKLDRMAAQSTRFEAGQVHLPKDASWLDAFLREILAFPNARNDDQVDSVSQFLNWACKRDDYVIGDGFGMPEIIYGDREYDIVNT